ncbi:MAG: hypothetical protein ACJAUC_002166 [Planctomycetota bacterium]|jgi:hypothetical protein
MFVICLDMPCLDKNTKLTRNQFFDSPHHTLANVNAKPIKNHQPDARNVINAVHALGQIGCNDIPNSVRVPCTITADKLGFELATNVSTQ